MSLFLRSTDGDDADNGTTWALAKAKMSGIDAIDTAGETVYVSKLHAETTAAAVTYAFAGTFANPTRLVCVEDSGDPATPATVMTGASISTTGASNLNIGGNLYARGIAFNCGASTASFASLGVNTGSNAHQTYENCKLYLNDTHGASNFSIGNGTGGSSHKTVLRNCELKTALAGQPINLRGRIVFEGGSFVAGNPSQATGIFGVGATSTAVEVTFDSFDFSSLAATASLLIAPTGTIGSAKFSDCKMPSSWTGDLVGAAVGLSNFRAEMYNCISGTTKIISRVTDAFGSIRDIQTVYRTGGFSVRGTPLSFRMTTSSNSKFPSARFESNQIERAFPGTDAEESAWVAGTSKTVTVEFVHDTSVAAGQGAGTSFAFQNDEFTLEVKTLNTLGAVTSTTVSSAPADILAAATDLASSSEAWTTTGLTTPVKQKFSVTIAPQEKGSIVARIVGFKTGKVIYYCPKLTVS